MRFWPPYECDDLGVRTYTLEAGGAIAEVVPERGGLITRFAVGGDEVLYLDPATLADETKNVRGGVPVLFPCAGKLDGGPYPLRQHGFARNMAFVVTEATADRLVMELASTAETQALFPFDFVLRLTVSLTERALTLGIAVVNTGPAAMPVHFGLHPYFRVPVEAKAQAAVETSATRAFDNTRGVFEAYAVPNYSEGETDLHLLDHLAHATTLRAPGFKPRLIEWDAFLPILVLWTQPEKGFICEEPWSAMAGELKEPKLWASPGETVGGVFRVSV